MKKLRSVLLAVTVAGLAAGIASAKIMPAEADDGLNTARDASNRDVPTATEVGGFLTDAAGHGEDVVDAATGDTPAEFDSHGEFVSSVATGWGEQISSEASAGASDAAADGLAHQP